jgi:hypothetical protein
LRHDYVDGRFHELGSEPGQPVQLAFGPAELERDVLSLDVTQLLQAGAQSGDLGRETGRRGGAEEADAMRSLRLRRRCRSERQRRQCCEHAAAPHPAAHA